MCVGYIFQPHSYTNRVRWANYIYSVYPPVANFLLCRCTRNYESWLVLDKVIAIITKLTFWDHPVYQTEYTASIAASKFGLSFSGSRGQPKHNIPCRADQNNVIC